MLIHFNFYWQELQYKSNQAVFSLAQIINRRPEDWGIENYYWSHWAMDNQDTSFQMHKCLQTKMYTFSETVFDPTFHALSHGVIRFVRSVSSRNIHWFFKRQHFTSFFVLFKGLRPLRDPLCFALSADAISCCYSTAVYSQLKRSQNDMIL